MSDKKGEKQKLLVQEEGRYYQKDDYEPTAGRSSVIDPKNTPPKNLKSDTSIFFCLVFYRRLTSFISSHMLSRDHLFIRFRRRMETTGRVGETGEMDYVVWDDLPHTLLCFYDCDTLHSWKDYRRDTRHTTR